MGPIALDVEPPRTSILSRGRVYSEPVRDTGEFLLIAVLATGVLMFIFLAVVATLLWTTDHLNAWTHHSRTRRQAKRTSQ